MLSIHPSSMDGVDDQASSHHHWLVMRPIFVVVVCNTYRHDYSLSLFLLVCLSVCLSVRLAMNHCVGIEYGR